VISLDDTPLERIPMKRTIIAAIVIAAPASAGVAVAHGIAGGAQGATAVNATFTATSVKSADTHMCTTAAGKTIASTKGTYTGTASGSPGLTGAATIAARSTIDTTDGVGVVNGTLKIGKTETHFSAVYDHGALAGTASGHGTTPHVQLLANVSATFGTTAGFTGGKIGGTSGGSAVELELDGCGQETTTPTTVKADGAITAVTAGSITVGSLTCTVPTSLAVTVATSYPVGTRVEIRCSNVGGTKTLVSVQKQGH
jgi:hypothetical protein